MDILLDTHFVLWVLLDSPKIKPWQKKHIQNPKNGVFASTVSLWEISLKYSLGKLHLKGITPEQMPELLQTSGYEILDLTKETASSFHKLSREHGDPFDRLLIWQAIENRLQFLSSDPAVPQYTKHGLRLLTS